MICVGNITAGGTGKTPTVIALAKLLCSQRLKIAILTRGYKRRSRDPILVVSDGDEILSTPQEAGDEPYLITSALNGVPVIAGKDRHRSGRYAIERFGADLFILDDGYQHIRLYRDINILLIDASNPFGNGCLLPKGILREPLRAISRADCIIISRANEVIGEDIESLIRTYNRNAPIFQASFRATDIRDLKGDSLGLSYIARKNLLLFSGIGNPHSFRRSIQDNSGRIKGEIVYPDHHWYTGKDLDRIIKEARSLSVDAMVTTEKDAVRLTGMSFLSEVREKILVLQVEMDMDKRLEEWIVQHVASLRTP